jgi:methionyl-tRNA formyltransferase
MYTPYVGDRFVLDWSISRSLYLSQFSSPVWLVLTRPACSSAVPKNEFILTESILTTLCLDLRAGSETTHEVKYWLPRLLKKFEVSKRLYRHYAIQSPHRMITESGYDDINLYLLLTESLIRAWAYDPVTQYINGILKLIDTLVSQANQLNKAQSAHLSYLIYAERIMLDKVLIRSNLKKHNGPYCENHQFVSLSFMNDVQLPTNTPSSIINSKKLNPFVGVNKVESPKVLLLCGHTARSVSYIQALSEANIKPDSIIIYGPQKDKPRSVRSLSKVTEGELFSANLNLDVFQSLKQADWQYSLTPTQSLSDPVLLALIEQADPDLIIYSGYGGQLVPGSLLCDYPVLHIHSGWLPDYRGSTTLYYQIIDQNTCAASAIFLDEQIDTGGIVARKYYPIPLAGMDVDYLYDNMIRADLLVEVLKCWQVPVEQWKVTPQTQDSLPYFIIHPLLKHLALLSVDNEKVDL